jgi:putative ABC transport system substrate-binding protein
LARPGGNVTGTCISIELSGKRVEIFKELLPSFKSIAVIYNPENVAKPLMPRTRLLPLKNSA